MKPEEREKAIEAIMEAHGVPRDEAEFILAIELGEIESDIIEVPPVGEDGTA